jgi:uncharacterized protein YkwD
MIRILWALCALMVASTPLLPGNSSNSESRLRKLEQEIFQKVNNARDENRVPQLCWKENLASEARRHAGNMAARRFFSHEDPKRGEISRRLDTSGINWNRCAENIYREQGLENPAEDAVKEWLESSGHRKNMLDRGFSDTGVGVAAQADGTIYVVQVFTRIY